MRYMINIVLCMALVHGVLFGAKTGHTPASIYSILPLEDEGYDIYRGIVSAIRDYQDASPPLPITYKSLDGGKSILNAAQLVRGISNNYPVILNLFTRGHVPDLVHDLFDEPKVLFFASVDNSDRWYTSKFPHIIHTQPPLHDEINVLVEYAVKKLEAHYIAVFYENSDYGRNGRDLVKEHIKKYDTQNMDVTFVGQGSYPQNSLRIHKAVHAISSSEPDVVICISRRHATYNFVNKMVDSGFFRTRFIGTSYLLPIQRYLHRSQGIQFSAVSPVPNLHNTSIQIIHEYHQSLKRHFPLARPSYLSLRGYINTRILLHALSRVNISYSLPNLMAAVRNIKHTEFGGLYLHFDEAQHNLMHDLWISEAYGKPMIQYRNGQALFSQHKKGSQSLWQSVRGIV